MELQVDTKNTNHSSNKLFALQDIKRRARLAVSQNPEFFSSRELRQRCQTVEHLVEQLYNQVGKVFNTPRPATSKRPANLEIKFSGGEYKLDFYPRLEQIRTQLAQMKGYVEIVHKPYTRSLSIHLGV